MTLAKLTLCYQAAWVRLHIKGANLDAWDADEVAQAFALLAPPVVTLAEWAARLNVDVAKLAQSEETAAIEQANADALPAIVASAGGIVTAAPASSAPAQPDAGATKG
jgi:hypothetical protein